MSYKVLLCIDSYIKDGGASVALWKVCKNNKQLQNPVIFCRCLRTNGRVLDECVYEGTGKDVVDYFVKNNYNIIHWFKSNGDELFSQVIEELHKRKLFVPIVTTMCQQPTYPSYQLTIREIENSLIIVFIDKTAYNNNYYSFIPRKNKRMIYFGVNKENIIKFETYGNLYNPSKKEGDPIIYGRGSSLLKCPKDMFEVFDKINPPKKFIIVGDGDRTWIEAEIEKRKGQYEVELIDNLPYEKWLEIESSFDVFLYYLPQDAYSSLDGTLGSAMSMSKPVVYCGPAAPKERLLDGYNAFVADSPYEIATLCNKLACNPALRVRLGRNARETTAQCFSLVDTIEHYNNVYEEVLAMRPNDLPKIPRRFKFKYYYDYFLVPQIRYKISRIKRLFGV